MLKRLNILLICDFHRGCAETILDHIFAFKKYSKHNVYILNSRGDVPAPTSLMSFDVIVLHYSIIISNNNYLNEKGRSKLRDYPGYKVVFIQDDYRWINKTLAALDYMKINAIFGLASPEVHHVMYPDNKLSVPLRKETVLAGYVPANLLQTEIIPHANRTCHIGYRARKLPAWLGEHAREKHLIAEKVLQDLTKYPDIKCDISCREEDRIYGKKWTSFLLNCRAVLGTESGSSVCDFTGEIQKTVEAHEKRDPKITFEELKELYFKDIDGKYVITSISPRAFEAAALKCLMIMYESDYSGVLKPYRHYLPLKRDHSNFNEIIEILRDEKRYLDIVERAYNEVVLNSAYQYQAMIQKFDTVVDESVISKELVTYESTISFYVFKLKMIRVYLFMFKQFIKSCLKSCLKPMLIKSIKKIIPKKYFPQIKLMLQKVYYKTIGEEE